MAGYVGKLLAGETLGATPFFAGQWREFSRVALQPGESYHLDADAAEYSVFVISGEGFAHVGVQAQPFDTGSAFTVGYRAQLRLVAGGNPVELFVTTLNIK